MKRMLFNATQQEELRVAIVDGQKLIDIDIETSGREQRKGNIYKGVITRIEPSLEACFVNYGEERHGFLPFKEVARSYFKDGVDVRNASIREALREGQELIVQVEKEERGNKGAALTTFVSLAGRYLVLMPNNPRGGGVSRRIEGEDRQELREAMSQLNFPDGMSIIARTAGIGRSAEELQWDLNYLLQLWTAVDGAASNNKAPLLIYLESSLVIRAIRDYFQPDIGEILIDTDDIYDQASAFMSVVMPDNMPRVKRYHDDVPLFSRFQIEHQIETAYSRTVMLPSGGAIVIDHTEALVSVDVNSARSTKGGDIEETAARTNLEAADEIARQLRLRDIGGLIVIDFIDMESGKNQKDVEQRLKDALRHDRARVQMGKISKFGLMELSRQRLRPSLSEGSHVTCPRCNGTGHIRDTESSALQVLRIIQEEAMKEQTAAIHCQVPVEVAAFLLNEKRSEITTLETRFKVGVMLIPNKHLDTPHYKLERLKFDDPRLDDIQVSYKLVEEAARSLESDTSIASKRKEEIKPRQEAAVKGITPDQPAPKAVPKPERVPEKTIAAAVAVPAATGGFFGWVKKLFGAKPAEPTPVVEAKPETRKDRQGNRNGRHGNRQDRGEGQGQQRGRGRNRQRGERDTEASTQTALQNQTPVLNTPLTQAALETPNSETKTERKEGRERNGRNRNRRDRTDKAGEPKQVAEISAVEGAALAGGAALALGAIEPRINDASTDANANDEGTLNENGVSVETTENGEERRRSRNRRGRNRYRRDREDRPERNAEPHSPEHSSMMSEAVETLPLLEGQLHSTVIPGNSSSFVETPDHTPAFVENSAIETTSVVNAATVQEIPVAPIAQLEPQAVNIASEVVQETTPLSTTITATEVRATNDVATQVSTPEISAPMASTAVAVTDNGQAAPASSAVNGLPKAHFKALEIAALNPIVQQAGMEWVHTDHEKHQLALAEAAKIIPAVHIPRERKPLPPLPQGPMILIETNKQMAIQQNQQ